MRARQGAMCNLYSMTRSQDELARLFEDLAPADGLGNLAPLDEIYPDGTAPVLLGAPDPKVVRARWGLPTPRKFLEGKRTDRGVTNVRNPGSPHWRRWLGPGNRCLVPFTRFAEPHHQTKATHWFATADGRLACFAGLFVPGWTSVRKLKDGETTDDLFGFLTTEPNAEVANVHPKAMPAILTEPAEWRTWLEAPWEEARPLQRPLPDGALIVEAAAAAAPPAQGQLL